MEEQTIFQDGKMIVRKTQDVSADIARASLLRDAHRAGGDMRLAGTIPGIVAEAWAAECGHPVGSHEFGEFVKRKLMDGEFAKFRVQGF
ncbi:MAG: hypothetical protein ACK4NW_01945 [Roseinatronobacter sp.]